MYVLLYFNLKLLKASSSSSVIGTTANTQAKAVLKTKHLKSTFMMKGVTKGFQVADYWVWIIYRWSPVSLSHAQLKCSTINLKAARQKVGFGQVNRLVIMKKVFNSELHSEVEASWRISIAKKLIESFQVSFFLKTIFTLPQFCSADRKLHFQNSNNKNFRPVSAAIIQLFQDHLKREVEIVLFINWADHTLLFHFTRDRQLVNENFSFCGLWLSPR